MSEYLLNPTADPALNALVGLQSPQVTTFKGFDAILTTTGTQTIWTPGSGKKFVLRGWHINTLVTVALTPAGGGAVGVNLYDATVDSANIVGNLTLLRNSSQDGEFYPSHNEYPAGFSSTTADQALIVGMTQSITTGFIRVCGSVWGTEA